MGALRGNDVMPHTRSLRGAQRNHLNKIVRDGAHCDYNKAEYINVLSEADLYDALFERYGVVDLGVLKAFVKGEVLSDGRGEGTLQRRIDDE